MGGPFHASVAILRIFSGLFDNCFTIYEQMTPPRVKRLMERIVSPNQVAPRLVTLSPRRRLTDFNGESERLPRHSIHVAAAIVYRDLETAHVR